jgi:hypothetical protein
MVSAGSASGLGDDSTKFDALLDAAYLHHDVALMQQVLAEDMVFTHGVEQGDGPVWDKRAFLDAAKTYTGLAWNVGSVRVERHGDVVETLGHIQVKTPDPSRPEYHVYFVRLYRRGPTGWQFVSHRTVREIIGPLPRQ